MTNPHDTTHSRAAARQLSVSVAERRLTCEGCHALQRAPRGMCRNEASPNYRQPRETHQERCASYVYGPSVAPPAAVVEAPRSRRRG